MKNLKLLSTKISLPLPKYLLGALVFLSALGFLDASYLTAKHYLASPVTCSILGGCEIVTTSKYSTFAGVPISLAGVFYYLTILLGSIFYVDTKKEIVIGLLSRFTITGFIISVYLTYLQFNVLKALCLYCLTSAGISTALFIVGILIIFNPFSKNIKKKAPLFTK